jgi:hypothetical protein
VAEQNEKDKQLARIEFRRKLATLTSKGKLEALIDTANALELVRSVPAEDLYYAIADVGLDDAHDVVQLASPTQFRTFLDLGSWKKDEAQPSTVLAWLHAAMGDDQDEFLKKLFGIDLEILELVLRRFITVYSLEETPDAHPQHPTIETPDGKYLVEIDAEGVELATLRGMISAIIAQNPFESTRLFEALRWEVPSELEETAYQFRTARLGDLGFPPVEEAMALFARVPVPRAPPTEASALQQTARVDFIGAALRGLEPLERERLEEELRYLVNSALVAEGADPGDLEAIRTVSERTRDYLALGLEALSFGDPSKAADAFRAEPSKRIFQLGFSVTLEVKFLADRLMREPLSALKGRPLALSFEASTIQAARRKRPMRALKVEGAEPATFRSRRELSEAEAVIARGGRQIAVLRALLGGTEGEAQRRLLGWPGEPTAERLLASLVAKVLFDGVAALAPIPGTRVTELLERLFEGDPSRPLLREGVREKVNRALEAALPEPLRADARELVNTTLERLRHELASAHLAGSLPPGVRVEILPVVD